MKNKYRPAYIVYKGKESHRAESLEEAGVLLGLNKKNVSKHLASGKPTRKGWYIVREFEPQLEIEGVLDLSESKMSVREFKSKLNEFLNSLDVVLNGDLFQLDNYGRRIIKG